MAASASSSRSLAMVGPAAGRMQQALLTTAIQLQQPAATQQQRRSLQTMTRVAAVTKATTSTGTSGATTTAGTISTRRTGVRHASGLARAAAASSLSSSLSPYYNNINSPSQYNNHMMQQHQTQTQQQRRSFSLFPTSSSNNLTASPWHWPIRSTNTIVNIVPQGHRFVVERFGKMHRICDSGLMIAIPLVDTISYVIDIRERVVDIPPQAAITRDNVSVEVSGNLMVCFVDAERAAYGALNPLYSVSQYAQSAMRSAVGELELDEILHGRQRLNGMIRGSLQEAAHKWGMEIRRYEITEITPDQQIRLAMDKQAAAERARREQVLKAEGSKRTAELESEGIRIQLQNESEGNLIKVRNEAEASKTKILLEAQATAEAIQMTATAQAEALQKVAEALQAAGGSEAARLALAKDYVQMYGEMGQQSNTILFQERPADVNALLGQAMTTLQAVGQASSGDKQPPSLPLANVVAAETSAVAEENSSEEEEKKN